MRRPIAGLLFIIAITCACLAVGGWLLKRTALSPERSHEHPATILADAEIRGELNRTIVGATAPAMYPDDPAASARVLAMVERVSTIPAGAPLFADTLADIHARLIGRSDGPVLVEPAQLVQIVRDEHAATAPTLSITVPTVKALEVADSVLRLLVPVTAIAALLFMLLCLLARPERDALFRSLGIGFVAMAIVSLVSAYVLPTFVPSLLSDDVWSNIPSRLAANRLPMTLTWALLLAAIGAVFYVASTRMRRSRRWSTPVSTYRYREERRWS